MSPLSRRSVLLALLSSPLATSIHAANAPVLLRDLYNKDLSFSPLAVGLAEQRISVEGFMAPPLRAESSFFVLTRRPMAVCPFCSDGADWPADIAAIYTKRLVKVIAFNIPIIVTGILETGIYKDPETGFVSKLRLTNARYEKI